MYNNNSNNSNNNNNNSSSNNERKNCIICIKQIENVKFKTRKQKLIWISNSELDFV